MSNPILTKEQAEILQVILRLWHIYPELRFGQLVDSFSGTCDHSGTCFKMFYAKDTDILKAFRAAEQSYHLRMETPG